MNFTDVYYQKTKKKPTHVVMLCGFDHDDG